MTLTSSDICSLREELRRRPRKAQMHQALGLALLDQGRYREASECFRRALELEPESDEAINALQKAETLLSKAACLRTLEGHSDQVHDISTIESGDEELLVSASEDASVRLWLPSSDNASEQQKLPHKDQVTKIVWDAASATLAVACLDDTCSLWQKTGASWRRSMVLRSKAGRFTCMRFLTADQAIITGSAGGALQKWNFKFGALTAGVQAHGGGVTDIALHPAGAILATSSGDGSCKLWNIATLACMQTLGADSGGVTSCHIALAGGADSAAGQHAVLVTTHLDPLRREARVLLWDADGSGRDGWVDGVLTAQYASIDGFRGTLKLTLVNSPWGLHAIASSAGMHLHVLDLEEGCCIFQMEDVASDYLAVSADGRHVACAGKTGDHISVYDIEAESMLLQLRCTLSCKEHGVKCLAWTADSALLISGGQDGTCKLWQV